MTQSEETKALAEIANRMIEELTAERDKLRMEVAQAGIVSHATPSKLRKTLPTGPWSTEKGRGRGSYTIIGSNLGGLVGAACPWPTELDTNDFSRVLANARLIAAAPELYEVLKITTRKLEAAYRSLGMPISENPHLKIAHEVLAKAEGNDQ